MADVNQIKLPNGSAYNLVDTEGRKEENLVWGGANKVGAVSPIGMSLSNEHSANRLAYINGDSLYFEYSSNSGSTWTPYDYTSAVKSQFCTLSYAVPIGRSSSSTNYSTSSRTRITLTAQNGTTGYVYTNPRKMLINISSSGGMQVLVEYRNGTNYKSGGAWNTFGTYNLSGWSGWNDIPLILGNLGGGTTQTGNIWQLRLTFIMTSFSSSYPTTAAVNSLRIYGENGWLTTSNMGATGHLYSYDNNQNATFPAQVSATKFNGTATNADKVNNLTVQTAVPANAKFTDTTYESKAATSGGTAVSLCTTGEKYTWNNKSNLTLGTTSTTALKGDTKYAGSSSAGGSATSAVKLDTATAGSATQPCYFANGVPSACTYSLKATVPSNAVFTDTRVKQTLKNTEGYAYPILFSKINANDSGDYAPDEVYRNNSFRIMTEADHSIATVSLHNKDNTRTIALQGSNGNIECTTINSHAVPKITFENESFNFTSSTTLSYIGKSISCAEGHRKLVRAYFRYIYGAPTETAVSRNSSVVGGYFSECIAYGINGASVCLTFMLNGAETVYLFAKYSNATANRVDIATVDYTNEQ